MRAVTVCTTEQSLKQLIQDESDSKYVPGNIQRKLVYMLGGLNFETDTFWAMSEQGANLGIGDVMVVGAHLYHHGYGALPHSPSVAGVVATHSPKATHFPGSVQLQKRTRTMEFMEDGKAQLKIVENTEIDGLKEMMKERFQLWKTSNAGPPSAVMFYRDAVNFGSGTEDHQETVLNEMTKIREAYKDVFDSDTSHIIYILIQRNARNGDLAAASLGQKETGEFFSGSTQKPNAYRYFIKFNDTALRSEVIQDLTNSLNKSSQLAAEVALALPVHFARKICQRMCDHFYFCQTRDIMHYPQNFCQTRDMMHYPQMVRNFTSQKRGDNEEVIILHIRSMLVGQDLVEKSLPQPTLDRPETKRDSNRMMLWHKKLDNLMFYL
ncbi:hypothetical protein M011DRAFT_313619 [Sporormia fimetaria CBS 119925]|uniref:Piwi domain-containing protein n=1 Tax=Sporormia fimetaria CBS 119925 TaxID=1340428 RepID=A0A6A6UUF0_9PLEO|nr:hypothetical protein M011DRAFT_313619 [Sporormia fimetaria CBS 119925]